MDEKSKPTIAELEALLNSREPLEIEILPDGSIHTVPAGTANNAKPTILTLRQVMGNNY